MLFTTWLDRNAAADPDGPALVLPGSITSHADLRDASFVAAGRLRAAGVRRGEQVALLLAEVGPDYVALACGLARLGAVAVCVNARFRARELEHALGNSGVALVLTSGWFLPVLADVRLPPGCRVVDIATDEAFVAGSAPRSEIVAESALVRGEDAARVIYTSGTTTLPKACLHTHDALVAQGESVAASLGLTASDRFWTALPLFHTGGWTPLLACQAVGAALHHAGRFEASAAWHQIRDQRCTVLFPGFETLWMDVLEQPDYDADAMPGARLVVIVGVAERLRVMQALHPRIPLVSNTGSTECGGFLCMGDPADLLDVRVSTVGRVIGGMEARIVDPSTRSDVPDGTAGELLVRGAGLFREYHADAVATIAAFEADGWFATGDLLVRQPDGRLRYMSRLKDMLKVGGENVAAAEIEDHLLTHPAVRIVAVVAAPDAHYGEVAAAFVELRPGSSATAADLIAHCRGAMASFKVPRYVRWVEEWPMSGTKIRKVDLRERIAAELRGR
jgi:fatty-acyl-CoA synthase